MRIVVRTSYDGSEFAGWQRQKNAHTVQEEIENQISVVFQQPISIVGCGRTDSGVHAVGYAFHCDLPDSNTDINKLTYRLNQMLPKSVAITSAEPVSKDFHARFDAISRSYTYHLHTTKDPFENRFSTYYPSAKYVDINRLHQVANMILQQSDFATFCKSDTDVKTTLCDIQNCNWIIDTDKSKLSFHITANRFLRGMIRLIVGTSINVGVGKLSLSELEKHILSGSKPPHIYSAPAEGLVLRDIVYPT